ncbi:DMT family transporter [Actinomadura rugatobispora]|uniref:DMT family transporter n=1 Tax=Actinomadura rugatobispora TaxID=1994 RepID=A0ABW1A7B9_9ACTN|nr:hypothetical protein GCM10010200_082370 [Actinomadura rugatobispora]
MNDGRSALGRAALYAAIATDAGSVFLLDGSDGFRRPVPAVAAVVAFFLELLLFAVALQHVEAGVAYALFGLSTAVVAVVSITVFGEPVDPAKATALVAVVGGAVLLQMGSGEHHPKTRGKARAWADRLLSRLRPGRREARLSRRPRWAISGIRRRGR